MYRGIVAIEYILEGDESGIFLDIHDDDASLQTSNGVPTIICDDTNHNDI